MDKRFDFYQEMEDQQQDLIEQYGESAAQYWVEDDFDGEFCNPPQYRWSADQDPTVYQGTVHAYYMIYAYDPRQRYCCANIISVHFVLIFVVTIHRYGGFLLS